jgi:hypothetical protein
MGSTALLITLSFLRVRVDLRTFLTVDPPHRPARLRHGSSRHAEPREQPHLQNAPDGQDTEKEQPIHDEDLRSTYMSRRIRKGFGA